jgi:hypothetical protein
VCLGSHCNSYPGDDVKACSDRESKPFYCHTCRRQTCRVPPSSTAFSVSESGSCAQLLSPPFHSTTSIWNPPEPALDLKTVPGGVVSHFFKPTVLAYDQVLAENLRSSSLPALRSLPLGLLDPSCRCSRNVGRPLAGLHVAERCTPRGISMARYRVVFLLVCSQQPFLRSSQQDH